MLRVLLLALVLPVLVSAHDAHGHSTAPIESRHLKNPISESSSHMQSAKAAYQTACASCHGADGRSRTRIASTLPIRPTDLSEYVMESMRDGEIYWVVTHGISAGDTQHMPAFQSSLSETQRWELVLWVRELRRRQRAVEVAALGPYEWKLPAGFPFPNVPRDNPMTKEKVELGRHLFYDRRLSLNQTQSCASCHRQEKAFTDGRARGLGSTGQLHPRGPMSLANVAYATTMTWANPNVRSLEQQALVPMFGETPVELGFSGKEQVLLLRLRAVSKYRNLFAAAFPSESDPFTIGNVTKAIGSFERTLISGDSPYDEYRRGDNADAISPSAKRGEALFFSERLECFHCHGGFNFTGSIDYLGKGIAETEFHNTGLYNLPGEFSYPKDNLGLYEFTQDPSDVGKFKAPTLRNIAVTAPYMHDGTVRTLQDSITHYKEGGRSIRTGPYAGDGSANPAKSEFVKVFEPTPAENTDLLAFLRSLTDTAFLTNPRFSDPWLPTPVTQKKAPPLQLLRGEVVAVFKEERSVSLYHEAVPGFIPAMKRPYAMEFQVHDPQDMANLKPGMKIVAAVSRQGGEYVLDQVKQDSIGKPK